jgi:hypothetical protein
MILAPTLPAALDNLIGKIELMLTAFKTELLSDSFIWGLITPMQLIIQAGLNNLKTSSIESNSALKETSFLPCREVPNTSAPLFERTWTTALPSIPVDPRTSTFSIISPTFVYSRIGGV